ncbi:hypothetical protein ANN_26588 [Periplaneta americana]|uniref:Uncharacterized protein n=1 Tax=Periplaneta americana TaxID=6978 RepID=A0ABQ8RYJ7_PERAM|nr:hypothetical protein ANN_26588 [Periplaneta americana]
MIESGICKRRQVRKDYIKVNDIRSSGKINIFASAHISQFRLNKGVLSSDQPIGKVCIQEVTHCSIVMVANKSLGYGERNGMRRWDGIVNWTTVLDYVGRKVKVKDDRTDIKLDTRVLNDNAFYHFRLRLMGYNEMKANDFVYKDFTNRRVKEKLRVNIPLNGKVTTFLTGHGKTGAYFYRFKLRDNPSCACGAEEQTFDHLLFECPKLDKERLAFQREMLRKTGKWTFTKLKIMQEHAHIFINYVNAINLDE